MNELTEITTYVLEKIADGSFDSDTSIALLERLSGGSSTTARQDVAIIGMSCKFPQADDYEQYWRNLINQVGVIGSFPTERRDDMGEEVKLKAGWLEHIGDFDAAFFKISPKEAITMHPEQRIFLEQAWNCLEDAGRCGDEIRGSKVGVYVGVDHSYPMDYKPHDAAHDLLDMTGSMSSVLASRIAYVLDLKGPNMVIDTACSSGLVAIHQACSALRAGDCDLALAGGLHLLSVTDASFEGVASEDGILSAFDRNSAGTVWGEGLGFVTLKSAERAVADGDHIYGVIRGIAINNDGHTSGITAPSADTQAEVIEAAWRQAGIDPEQLSYVEAHATGTILGDPIEINGLRIAFSKFTERRQFCALGSVKPNLGHGVSSASMSSLIKLLLALREGQLPPNINFTEPNPYIELHESPLYVSDSLRPWEPNGPTRLAGVSSFGFGRTNVHAVIEQAPAPVADERARTLPLVLALSGRTAHARADLVGRYLQWFSDNPDVAIEDTCFTAALGRMHFEHRLAIVGSSRAEILRGLRAAAAERWEAAGVYVGHHRALGPNMTRQDEHDLTVADRRRLGREVTALSDRGLATDSDLTEFCRLYVAGADASWASAFADRRYRRVPLPTYPFQRKHFWLPLEKQTIAPSKQVPALHPLIDRLAVAGRDQDIYSSRFQIGKQWILSEHLINGSGVIPGTAFLEMLYTACAHTSGSRSIELTDVLLQAPAVVLPDQPLDIQIVITKTAAGMDGEVMSCDTAGNWTMHATARGLVLDPDSRPAAVDHVAIECACEQEELPFDLSQEYGGFRFGPRWRNVSRIVYNDEQHVLTTLRMDPAYLADLADFTLHPALFDNALNIAGEFLIQNVAHTMFLPFSCKSMKIFDGLPAEFRSHQWIRNPIKKQMGAAAIDVTLYAPDGTVLCVLEKYSLKRVTQELFVENRHHQLSFTETAALPAAERLGTVLYVGSGSEHDVRLASGLRGFADRVIEVSYGDGFSELGDDRFSLGTADAARLLDRVGQPDQIVHASTFALTEARSAQELIRQREHGLSGLHDLVATLARGTAQTRLCVLSSRVHLLLGDADAVNPIGAAALALARVAAAESARIAVTGIDADDDLGVELLAAELAHGQEDRLVALRGTVRHTPVIEEAGVETFEAEQVTLRTEGIYLITGGLDGTAGVFIAALTSEESRPRFAVLSRTPIPEQPGGDAKAAGRARRLAELRAAGARVETVAVDVTDAAAVATAVADLRARYGRINGLIHGAGNPGGSYLINRSAAEFESVIRPKIDGSWALRRATVDDELDFTLLSSSLISIFGPPGQGDYAAANAYLNGLAAADRGRGRKTTAIAWSLWSQTGMARNFDMDTARGVFRALSDDDGASSFRSILDRRVTTILVGALDRERVQAASGEIGVALGDSLAARMAGDRRRATASKPKREVEVIGRTVLTETQIELAHLWAAVQGLDEVDVGDALSESGGDSIVLSQYVGAINDRYGKLIDISDVYAQPTVAQLADFLDRQRNPGAEVSEPKSRELSVESIMAQLESGELSLEAAGELLEIVAVSQ